MKYGISFKIDVTKIDKKKIYEGKKGKYITVSSFVDVDMQDNYGNNGLIKQDGEKGEDMPIIGNAKVFWSDNKTEPVPDDNIAF